MNKITSLLISALLVTPLVNTAHAKWELGDICYGYATATGSGYSGGALLLDPIPQDMEITALNRNQLDYRGVKAALAGAYLQVSGPNGSTVVYVTDLYPEGGDCALDLSFNAFEKIGDLKDGKIDINWVLIEAPVNGNVVYRIKEGSNPYWAAVQFRNVKYPVIEMKYMRDNQWISAPKTDYNHFILEHVGNNNIAIEFTDIKGNTLRDTLPPMLQSTSSAYLITGNVQL
ncbi:expansin EXLX1 family cellulose-binding protein [Brenneria izbisi]|uniref:Expansin-YoaJ n=1 Tax=Brenneria izbisi TaxID=2939450 RepID=A0AA41XVX0_9GAMM|nr:expansin EXLX1 family cellulose-binding protein [Brenneria izbisi]MCV9877421.1 Expansin-YoaJ [Brenneria izbisi]MCV9881013.1 Expansin-YoaJ [Brenneria izbisi]